MDGKSQNLDGNNVGNTKSEFYLDLLEVFGDSNNNNSKTVTSTQKVSNPTIIRPIASKKPRPAPRTPSKYGSISMSTAPKPAVRKKKAPPRPPPPRVTRPAPSNAAQRLTKVPPSYSKVLEEDIRACISAYSDDPRERAKSTQSDSSASHKTHLSQSVRFSRSKSDSRTTDLIHFDSPAMSKPAPHSINVNGVKVTSKNAKQAGAIASFLNHNPKLAKKVVPSEYQGAVKVAGKAYDFREEHKKTTPIDFLGGLSDQQKDVKKQEKSTEEPLILVARNASALPKQKIKKPPKPPPAVKPTVQPIEVSTDLNAGWGDDGSSHKVEDITPPEVHVSAPAQASEPKLPSSPSIPEPEHPPPVLEEVDESLPSFEPQGIALVNYTASKPGELSFQTKDIIMLLKEEGEMFYGKIGMEEGYFPKFCVDVLFPLPCNNEEVTFCAIRDHQDPGQLSSVSGDEIIVEKILDSNTMRGTLERPGVCGDFPASCVAPMNQNNISATTDSETVATALYDYEGDSAAGDINFKAGDKIEVLSEVSSDWLYGKCNGQVGNFPAAFIDSIPGNLPKYTEIDSAPPILHQAIAVFDFIGAADDELTFAKDDEIAVVDEIDDSWWRGYVIGNVNRIGIFPKAYVDVMDVNANPDVTVQVRALYQFDATSQDELSFQVNDVITVTQVVNKEWMIGYTGNSKEGLFPSSFVTSIS